MKCDILKCAKHEDCLILEIIKKQPKDWRSCSYFKTQEQTDKKEEKKLEDSEKPKRKYKKKTKEK